MHTCINLQANLLTLKFSIVNKKLSPTVVNTLNFHILDFDFGCNIFRIEHFLKFLMNSLYCSSGLESSMYEIVKIVNLENWMLKLNQAR